MDRIEREIEKFLDKVLKEFIMKQELQGKWILYIPIRDEYHVFDSRDEALKFAYREVRDVEYMFLIQIPLPTEESYQAFTRMLTSSR